MTTKQNTHHCFKSVWLLEEWEQQHARRTRNRLPGCQRKKMRAHKKVYFQVTIYCLNRKHDSLRCTFLVTLYFLSQIKQRGLVDW